MRTKRYKIEIVYFSINKKRKNMTVEQLSSNELTLLSSLIKQSKEKLNKIIFQTGKVNDVRSERLIKIVELAISLK